MALDLQFYTLFVMILTGVAAGLVFDLLRALRGMTHARGIVADLWDLLFWVVLTVLVAAGLVVGNWGHLRFSILLGVLLGLWIYTELASELVVRGFRRLLQFIGAALMFLVEVIETIIIWPLELVLQLVSLILELVAWLLVVLVRIVAWPFRPLWRAIYPSIEPKLGYYRHRAGPLLFCLRRLLK